jgi:hypothetical protein
MQDYCGRYKNETTLNLGLRLLKEIKENEAAAAYASNPHELGRTSGMFSPISMGEMIMNASLARKCSSLYLISCGLIIRRWTRLTGQSFPMRQKIMKSVQDLSLTSSKAPYASGYEANYHAHCGL